jgi:hypothetical protein
MLRMAHRADRIPGRAVRNLLRGGVLFEVMLSVALFGGAAAFTLASVRTVLAALERSAKQQQAVDLACSTLARLEAGLISINQLRGEHELNAGENGWGGGDGEAEASTASTRWRFTAAVQPSAFTGLTLVELTVEEVRPAASSDSVEPMRYTLRQLVRLRPGSDAGGAALALPMDREAAR